MADWICSHRFWLRPDCVICLSIPQDFTRQDAKRLENWVKSLPTVEDGVLQQGNESQLGFPLPNPAELTKPSWQSTAKQ